MEYYNSDEADSIKIAMKKLNETIEITKQNLDSIMERGETLDIIVEKSKKLNFESNSFIKKVPESQNFSF